MNKKSEKLKKVIILFSGGIDSTVLLAMAKANGAECHLLSFDYGQRHRVELKSAAKIADYYQVSHKVIVIDPSAFGKSSLVFASDVPKDRTGAQIATGGIPSTYVPARNTLFLAYATGQAELLEAEEIQIGSNAQDFGAYPDCRPEYMNAFQSLLNVATKQAVEGNAPKLVVPLVNWNKARIIEEGRALSVPFELTFSCYDPQGDLACERCDACRLRREGFLGL